jgi:hypothetical protein
MPTTENSFIGIAGHDGDEPIPGATDRGACAATQPSAAIRADQEVDPADGDHALVALGKQFEQIAVQVQRLQAMSSEDDCLELTEAMLGRLEPIERAIIETPARTAVGLGVKARHAAYVMSEYWAAPIDRIDWDARAIRLLIEAVCEFAGMQLPPEEGPSP